MSDLRVKALTDACKSIDTAARTVRHWISRESVDRVGDVLVADGCNPAKFVANPVVLWAHDNKILPIGKAVDGSLIKIQGDGVEATTQFAEHGLAADVFDLYAGGFLKAFSVGFRATALGERAEGQRGDTITGWDLMEYSAVPVPAHADALVKAAGEGSDLAGRMLQLYYPDERDAVGAARVACDVRRVMTGLESLRNHARHCKAIGQDFDTEPLAKAAEFLTELGIVPAPPATPQTDAGATDGDLPEEAVEGLRSLMAELRDYASARRRDDIARQARRALIGGGYPR